MNEVKLSDSECLLFKSVPGFKFQSNPEKCETIDFAFTANCYCSSFPNCAKVLTPSYLVISLYTTRLFEMFKIHSSYLNCCKFRHNKGGLINFIETLSLSLGFF